MSKTRSEQIRDLIFELTLLQIHNPVAQIAIDHIRATREQYKDWHYEDELPNDYDYDANFDRSEIIDGVRMFPRNTHAAVQTSASESEVAK